jgi:hypothetical protein
MTDGQGWAAPGSPPPGYGPGIPGGPPPGAMPPGAMPHGAMPPGPMPPRPDAPKPGIIPLRPLRVSDLLDGAITYMRRNVRAVIGLSLIVSLLSQCLVAVTSYFSLGDLMRVAPDPNGGSEEIPTSALIAPLTNLIPAFLFTTLAILVLSGMLTTVVGRAVLGGTATIGQAWRDVRRRIPALLATAFITLLLTLVAMAIPLAPVVLLALSDAAPLVIVLIGLLGFLLAMAAATWIFVSYAFATPAVVLEGTGVFQALARSYRLVHGAWWRTLGLLLLAQLIAGLIGGAVQTPFTIGSFAVGFAAGDDLSGWMLAAYLALGAIGGIIAGTLTYPFTAGVTTLLYVDRRMRREGLDLELRTESERYPGADLSTAQLIDLWRPRYGAPSSPPSAPPHSPPPPHPLPAEPPAPEQGPR